MVLSLQEGGTEIIYVALKTFRKPYGLAERMCDLITSMLPIVCLLVETLEMHDYQFQTLFPRSQSDSLLTLPHWKFTRLHYICFPDRCIILWVLTVLKVEKRTVG